MVPSDCLSIFTPTFYSVLFALFSLCLTETSFWSHSKSIYPIIFVLYLLNNAPNRTMISCESFFCQPAQVCSQSYLFLIPCFNLSNLRFYWIDYDIFYTHHFHLFNWNRLRCLQCMQLLPAIVWALFKFVVVKCLGIH